MKKRAKEKTSKKFERHQYETDTNFNKTKHVYCNSPFSFSYYSLINNLDAAAPERITDLPDHWMVVDTVDHY